MGNLRFVILALAFLLFACEPEEQTPPPDRYLTGAYYYHWYPENYYSGTLRSALSPSQRPQLGWYKSTDIKVAEQHIAWASRFGIDFFALDYWPDRTEQNQRIDDTFLQAKNIGDIKFAIMFETWALNYVGNEGATYFTQEVADRFYAELVSVADRYFDHPSYLKVDGRPVIFLYLTRTFHGQYSEPIKKFRDTLGKKGIDPFIIGDEIFWRVVSVDNLDDFGNPNLVTEPQPSRINLFDAITAYNLYHSEKPEHAGYGSDTSYTADISELYAIYREAADKKVSMVPGITPGYNDRGVRVEEDFFVIPRQWAEDESMGTFFEQSLEQIGIPQIDPDLGMIMITTWNEWNEDTAIEPVWAPLPTNKDKSHSGFLYTQGYTYRGFGTTYLEIIRDKMVSVAGRVVDLTGAPVWGEVICAYGGKKRVTCSVTNREGYYRLTRLKLPPATYNIGPENREERTTVEVTAKVATTGVNFAVER